METGPGFGYNVDAKKSFLIVKPECRTEAEKLFAGTGVTATDGHMVLGSFIGAIDLCAEFLAAEVERLRSH